MAKSKRLPAPSFRADQREFKRFEIHLPGYLFIPADGTTIECQVFNLSGGGASIQCETPPALQTYIVLYIDGFGRFEGVTSRLIKGELGIKFVCNEAKRKRLKDDLMSFVNSGIKDVTRLRRHARAAGGTSGFFVTRTGQKADCGIIDFSVQGMSLKASVRPPLGDVISLGKYHGLVIRHHQAGFAVQFLEAVAASARA